MGSSGMGSLAMVSLSLNEGSNQYSHVQSRVHNKSMNSQMSSTYTGGYMSKARALQENKKIEIN